MRIRFIKAFSQFLLFFFATAACAGTPPVANTGQVLAIEEATEFPIAEEKEDPVVTPTSNINEVLASGQDLANRGDWENAISIFDLAISVDPNNALAFQLRGDARRSMGNIIEAIADYDQAFSLDPLSASALNSRGLAHTELGENARALSDFSQAVDLQPGFGLAYRNRAEVQVAEGKYEAAVLDLQIYLALVPNALDRQMVESQIAELQGDPIETADENGLLYFDDFSNDDSGWYYNGDPSAFAAYEGGGYRIVVTQETSAVWAVPGRLFTDVRIEVSADKKSGDDDNFFGLMCRVQGSTDTANFYLLMISSDGYYGIAKRVNGGELILVGQEKMQFSNAINLGSGMNQVRADCVGDTLSLYANDVLLVEVVDSDLTTGQVGLLAGTFSVPGTNILFDDLAIYAQQSGE